MHYCKFCGSSDLVRVRFEGKTSPPGVNVGINPPSGGGVNVGVTPGGQQTIEYPTMFCPLCREIDASCTSRPLLAEATFGELRLKFILPSHFTVLLKTLGASERELRHVLEEMVRVLRRPVKRYLRTGANPCRKRHMGFPLKVKIHDRPVDLHLVLGGAESGERTVSVRVVYGGGMAQCP